MRLDPLPLIGAFLIVPEPHTDERGFFARTACEDEFAAHGLVGRYRQSSISYNARRGTVRGMHFSAAPGEETKVVRCTSGEVHDVIVDLRPDSETYLEAIDVRLSAANRHALYIPKGLAHGFQALRDETELLYMIDVPFVAGTARGIRWDDPVLAITWPERVTVISERDRSFPDFVP